LQRDQRIEHGLCGIEQRCTLSGVANGSVLLRHEIRYSAEISLSELRLAAQLPCARTVGKHGRETDRITDTREEFGCSVERSPRDGR
jgi:hypothetical protein